MMAEPVYRQIADDLRRRIESGELGPGSQLPTELELREMFDNASRNTVRDAVKSLANSGLVVTRPGLGTFVADPIVPFAITMSGDPATGSGGGEGVAYMDQVRAQARHPTASEPRVEIQPARNMIAHELQLSPGELVVSRHQQLRIDGKPWSMQTSFYPMKFTDKAPRLVEATDIENGVVAYLRETHGMRQAGYQDRITARPPNQGEILFFRIPAGGTAMIETVRTGYEKSGRPIRCTVTVWPADRNQIVYNVGTVPKDIATPAQVNGSDSASGSEGSD
jgi:GntR family transcriptional regulator